MGWAKDFGNLESRRVGYSKCSNGFEVSTVWVGIGVTFEKKKPLIFESMVWNKKGDVVCKQQYSTEAKAKKEHAVLIREYKKFK